MTPLPGLHLYSQNQGSYGRRMTSPTQQKRKANAQTPAGGIPSCVESVVPGLTHLGPDDPHNFSKLGKEYLEAAKTLDVRHPNEPDWPTFFVVCQALELYLKAFLRAHGVSVEDLINRRMFGHDLQLGFDKAMKLGLDKTLDFTRELGERVEVINRPYKERDFQYKHSGSWELTHITPLILLVERVGHKLDY